MDLRDGKLGKPRSRQVVKKCPSPLAPGSHQETPRSYYCRPARIRESAADGRRGERVGNRSVGPNARSAAEPSPASGVSRGSGARSRQLVNVPVHKRVCHGKRKKGCSPLAAGTGQSASTRDTLAAARIATFSGRRNVGLPLCMCRRSGGKTGQSRSRTACVLVPPAFAVKRTCRATCKFDWRRGSIFDQLVVFWVIVFLRRLVDD